MSKDKLTDFGFESLKADIAAYASPQDAIQFEINALKQQNAQLAAHNRVLVDLLKKVNWFIYPPEVTGIDEVDDKRTSKYNNISHKLDNFHKLPSSLRAQRELAVLEAVKEWFYVNEYDPLGGCPEKATEFCKKVAPLYLKLKEAVESLEEKGENE